jgi:hypothetical protein
MSLVLTTIPLVLGQIALREDVRANYAPLNDSVGPLTSAVTPNPWLSHACVSVTSTTSASIMVPVNCAQPHDGRIVARVTRAEDCPTASDEQHYEPTINYVFCIDTST